MRLSRRNQRENFSIDLTTCSDIIFTLLIFYILTQSFVTQVPTELPQLKSDMQNLSQEAMRLEISKSGQFSLNDQNLGENWERALGEKLAVVATDTRFLILVHKQAPAGLAIELLDRMRLNGVTNVAFGGLPLKEEKSVDEEK